MQVITFLNWKGGVGKTTITAAVAAALAMLGYRVCMIDTDPQGHLTVSVDVPRQSGFMKFAEWANPKDHDFTDLREIIMRVPQDNCPAPLYVVPGSGNTKGIAERMTRTQIVKNIKRRFDLMANVFDYVLIDTQPSPSSLHDALALMSDWIIIPTDCEPFGAIEGVDPTVAFINELHEEAVARGWDKARLMGILPNKYIKNTINHRTNYKGLVDDYGKLVMPPIPWRVAVPDSQMARLTVMQDSPDSEVRKRIEEITLHIELVTQGAKKHG